MISSFERREWMKPVFRFSREREAQAKLPAFEPIRVNKRMVTLPGITD
jgi:hypothetical protein